MEVCVCCFESLSALLVAKLPCGHRFHEACMETWAERSATCPLCRKNGSEMVLLPARDADAARDQLTAYRADHDKRMARLEKELDAFKTTRKRKIDDRIANIRRVVELDILVEELGIRIGADLCEKSKLDRLVAAMQTFPDESRLIESDQKRVKDQISDRRRRLRQVLDDRSELAVTLKIS